MPGKNGKQQTRKNGAPPATEGGDPTEALAGLSDEQKAAVAQLLASKDEQIAQLQQAQNKAEDGEPDGDEEPVAQAQAGAGTEDGGVPDSEEQGSGTTVTVSATTKAKLSKAEQRIASLEKALNEERNVRANRDFLEKARAFDAIPVPAEKVAGLMRAVTEKAKEHAPVLDMVLKACNELASSSDVVTKSIGAANGKSTGMTSARAEVDAEVSKLMSEDPKLTKAKATQRLFKSRPMLYQKLRDEQDGKR